VWNVRGRCLPEDAGVSELAANGRVVGMALGAPPGGNDGGLYPAPPVRHGFFHTYEASPT